MTKLLLKIVLFIIVFVVIFRISEKFFIKEDRFNYTKYHFTKVCDTLDFDVLFFGSSKSYCSYNPSIIKYNLGLNTYNLAGQGQVLEVTNFIIEEALKSTTPKLIVVDLSYNMLAFNSVDSIAKKSKSYQLKIFDNYNLSINKFNYLQSIYSTQELISIFSPITRNHNNWVDVVEKNYTKDYLTDKNNYFLSNNGYIGTMHEMDKVGLEIAKKIDLGYDILKSKKQLKPSKKEIEVIEKTVEIAKKNNVDVLFVSVPSVKGYINHLSFYERLESLLRERNLKYLNLNKNFNEIDLSIKDFKDIQHLNYSGGYKVSQFLSKYISKTFKLEKGFEYNALDKNVTYHMLSNLDYTSKIIEKPFQFDSIISVKEVAYFEELDDRFSFIFKLEKGIPVKDLDKKYRGYIRIYKNEINNENKQVISFPLKIIEVGDEKYIFARDYINTDTLSQFDIFFIEKKSNKASKFFTIKNLNLE